MKTYNKIHFIGIGGIGVSALARWFLNRGAEVSGSDIAASEIISELKNLGAKVYTPPFCKDSCKKAEQVGHCESNLENSVELVVYSPAAPKDNPELKKARDLKIPVKSYPEMLGAIMKDYSEPIAVSGTNGKTTTTAVLGLILEKAGFDPTVIVGGKIFSPSLDLGDAPRGLSSGRSWNGNLRIGSSKYFITEACEYRRAMLNLGPKMIVLTNIEEDHLDYFKDLEDIKSAFKEYVGKLPPDGILVFNQDNSVLKEIADGCKREKISYSVYTNADLQAKNISQESGKQSFNLIWRGKDLGRFTIFIPGIFNIYNCLAASALVLRLGVQPEIIKELLTGFKGIWRRFERVGELNGKIVISDYAHHPTAVRETIAAARKFYPGKKILAVFQPHHEVRLKKLFSDFTESFSEADATIISEIYFVAGRESAPSLDLGDTPRGLSSGQQSEPSDNFISSLDLVEAIKQTGYFPVFYASNLKKTKKMILSKMKGYDIILIMGAGDIFRLALELANL